MQPHAWRCLKRVTPFGGTYSHRFSNRKIFIEDCTEDEPLLLPEKDRSVSSGRIWDHIRWPRRRWIKLPSALTAEERASFLPRRRRCRSFLPSLTTISIIIIYTLMILSSTTMASPLPQAIPDSTGNDGSGPCQGDCNILPAALASSTLSSAILSTSVPSGPSPSASLSRPSSVSSSATSVSTSQGTTTQTLAASATEMPNPAPSLTENPPVPPNPNPNANAQEPDNISENPNSTPAPLTLTSPQLALPIGAIAGIAGGGLLVVIAIAFLLYWIHRGRNPDIKEISIRRSKLGSRLGFRIFGNDDSEGRSRSRQQERDQQNTLNEKNGDSTVWQENGLLAAPKPSFLSRQETSTAAPWVDKGSIGRPKPGGDGFIRLWDNEKDSLEKRVQTADRERGEVPFDRNIISAPRPARPASAEPLGRLSGLGMGMGYLK